MKLSNLIKIASCLIAIFVISIFTILLNTRELDISLFTKSPHTVIYDKNNDEILSLGLEKHRYVEFEEISPHVTDALISTEDKKFFDHQGIDFIRFGKAMLINLKELEFKEGASTITQQLIKNTHLSNEKTIIRKIREMYLAYKLEKVTSKEDILEYYLNRVSFGSTVYGIESASIYYFNKPNTELTVAEASTLIGLLKSPTYYSPYLNYDNSIERRNLVLRNLYTDDVISKIEYDDFKNDDLVLVNGFISEDYKYYSDYIDYTIHEAKKLYDIDLFKGNMEVYTNIDLSKQEQMHKTVNQLNTLEGIESASVLINNDTHQIEGIISSKENNNSLSLSYAYKNKLQVASTIKPLLDYAPLFEYYHYSTASVFTDEPINYTTGEELQNWDYLFKGDVSLRKALVESRNVPAYKAYKIASDYGYEILKKVNLNLTENKVEAHSIGGFQYGFSLLDITNAYTVFPNNGQYADSYAINKIVLTDKTVIEPVLENKKVLSPSTCFMINDILEDLADSLSVAGIYFPNKVVAGKTGQSNFDEETRIKNDIPESGIKDLWMIGYNDNYTLGVWSGSINNSHYIPIESNRLSQKVFSTVLNEVSNDNSKILNIPNNVIGKYVESNNSKPILPSTKTPTDLIKYEYFIKGTEPYASSKKYTDLEKVSNINIDFSKGLKIDFAGVMPKNSTFGDIVYKIYLVKGNLKTLVSESKNTSADLDIDLFTIFKYDKIEIVSSYEKSDYYNNQASEKIDQLRLLFS